MRPSSRPLSARTPPPGDPRRWAVRPGTGLPGVEQPPRAPLTGEGELHSRAAFPDDLAREPGRVFEARFPRAPARGPAPLRAACPAPLRAAGDARKGRDAGRDGRPVCPRRLSAPPASHAIQNARLRYARGALSR
ncbi:hypothetical protein Sgou_36030 [Streptomyces gougerotii]|uniref:Uncharacterized protein n=2 Tax=Streptomyces diastaticus group TaxID=2849069 RepID=A0A8H9HJL5_9ACTN|nr:hypothetical protein [Streptomyces sp. DSM 41037]GFH73890.1 hypothetical protein Sdia_46580 [Streptomyces diastaticus subsp. diastaticus]GFH78933.1 hypothetical protein Sgou_36030 [Streptomyces gougerotii]GGU29075.1 hypothetical protein GCM10015534_34690 [Streptomyces diastaticus subsp. diastaticus]GGU69109.1 hypothetical protein GCM10010227_23840 [Streptomyces gougerotii]